MKKIMKKIIHFHPSGSNPPNGSYVQRGGYFNECRRNREAVNMHNASSLLILPATDEKSKLSTPAISDLLTQWTSEINQHKSHWIEKVIAKISGHHFAENASFTIGRFFEGSYTSSLGIYFDQTSACIAFCGVNRKNLLTLASRLGKAGNCDLLIFQTKQFYEYNSVINKQL
jgi:hypothetical protein